MTVTREEIVVALRQSGQPAVVTVQRATLPCGLQCVRRVAHGHDGNRHGRH